MTTEFRYTAGKFGVATLDELAILIYPLAWKREQFDEFIDLLASLNHSKMRGILVWAQGQAPGAAERQYIAHRLPPPLNVRLRQALITDSMLIRGVLTALSWLFRGGGYEWRAFGSGLMSEAFDWLAVVAQFDKAEARLAFTQLRDETHPAH